MMNKHRHARNLYIILAMMLTLQNVQASSSWEEDDDAHENKTQTTGARKGAIIIDTTGNPGVPGVMTNMRTGTSTTGCSKTDAINGHKCNSFSTNDIQVMQAGGSTGLISEIGVRNPNSTSYQNFGKSTQLNFFSEEQLLDINKLRAAAKWLSNRSASVNTPPGTYGDISWQQFVQNVAVGRTMYGIVRVKIPLERDSSDDRSLNESADNYFVKTSSASYFVKTGQSSNNFKQYYDFYNTLPKQKSGKYRFCGKNKPTVDKCGCTPDEDTALLPGEKVCGIKLGENAKIEVRGAIVFDFVDCDDNFNPVPLANFPKDDKMLSIKVGVPININPANLNLTDKNNTLQQIAALTPSASCVSGGYCQAEVTKTIPFSLVPQDVKDRVPQLAGASGETYFKSLPKSTQYNYILPSGYVAGWLAAFNTLNITRQDWETMGFTAPLLDRSNQQNKDTSKIIADEIRDSRFEDIPVYVYTGGLIDMHYNLNISGLVYIPQALELEQTGLAIESHNEKHEDDDRDYRHEYYDDKDVRYYKDSKGMKSYSKPSDDPDDDVSKPKRCVSKQVRVASSQYIRGAIIVRDAFYINPKENGITLLSNDPDSYSQIQVSRTSGIAGTFNPLLPDNAGGGTNGGGSSGGSSNGNGTPGNGGSTGSAKTKDWVEIKPL